jgi:hypothetical protein
MSEKRVPRRIFRPKRKKVAEGWRSSSFCKMSFITVRLTNIIRVIKSRRMRWGGT